MVYIPRRRLFFSTAGSGPSRVQRTAVFGGSPLTVCPGCAISPANGGVAEMIPEGARLADVGTDHAYLPVWLLQNGRIPSAIASDVREGPLSRARATARACGCFERMSFRLCDGLSGIAPEEVDALVIAGMGGETIANILEAAPWVKEKDFPIILQPMSTQAELRGWLWRNGFLCLREKTVFEGETLYSIILARHRSDLRVFFP